MGMMRIRYKGDMKSSVVIEDIYVSNLSKYKHKSKLYVQTIHGWSRYN